MKRTPLLEKARTIDELRKYCKPTPLTGDALKFYIETDKARDPHQDTRNKLAKSLEEGPSRILFYGHPGSGKSTELNKFLEEQKEKWLPVKFSVLDEMTSSNILAEDLILIITIKIMQAANKVGIQGNQNLLEDVYNYFSKVTKEESKSQKRGIGAKAGIDIQAPATWDNL